MNKIYVSQRGSDSAPGTEDQPFLTLEKAKEAVRSHPARGTQPIQVLVKEGVYYLDETLVFEATDSGTSSAPITWKAEQGDGAEAIISGGLRLELTWEPVHEMPGVFKAQTPEGVSIDQFFVNGQRQHMARYPNFDVNARPYNGASADAFSPERAKNWADPAGGYIHAMHSARWGGYHYHITGKDKEDVVSYEGGWQNNRQMGMHDEHRFVENIFEELDAPGEWYHKTEDDTLFYMPAEGVELQEATFEVVRLRHLVELCGNKESPVGFLSFKGFTFKHAARTFMETKEPLLRSDWAIYRGGAFFLTGATDVTIENCFFDQVGGNGVFVNNFNRRVQVKGCHILGAGASGVCFVGNPDTVRNPLFEYQERLAYENIDLIPGPKGDDLPEDCSVSDCLIHEIGVVEKQATGVQVSMSHRITISHTSIYDVGRAGINISEGTFGGHLIEYCDVFDTVLETSDHGSFNSWGRDRFWQLEGAPKEKLPELALLDAEKTVIRNSRWRCDHGWDIDLDDGSSNYEIYNNLMLNRGLKFREGFYRKAYNNITVNNSFHPHVWYEGSKDVVTHNIWFTRYRPSGMKHWGEQINHNLFVQEAGLAKAQEQGTDADSWVGDPLFLDPEQADYRVAENSPALKLGFKNFPMDEFGVKRPELQSIARTPQLPVDLDFSAFPDGATSKKPESVTWLGATLRGITGEEFSAFGTIKEDGGLAVLGLEADSILAKAGLNEGDLVSHIDGIKMVGEEDLKKVTQAPQKIILVRGQSPLQIELR